MGLVFLMLQHNSPKEYLSLMKALILEGHMQASVVYDALKDIILSIKHPNEIINQLQKTKGRLPHARDRITSQELRDFALRVKHDDESKNTPIDDHSNNSSGVNITARKSTQQLLERYPAADLQWEYTDLLDHIQNIEGPDRVFIDEAIGIISKFERQGIRHSLTQLSLQDILGLTWHAVKDDNPEVWTDTTHSWHQNRKHAFIQSLAHLATFKQRDALNPERENHLCFTGLYNYPLEKLDRFHVDVRIENKSPQDLMIKKIRDLLKNYFSQDDISKQRHHLDTMDPDGKKTYGYQWLEATALKIKPKITEEFGTHLDAEIIHASCDPANLLSLESSLRDMLQQRSYQSPGLRA
jgi:hypothetical protein